MNHRTTWWTTAAVAAVFVIGGSAYAWGHQQQLAKQQIATMVNTQYNGTFHTVIADVESLRNSLGACLVTNDQKSFNSHLSDVAKYAYAAQSDLNRLPNNQNGDRHFTAYLHDVDDKAKSWITEGAGPTSTTRSKLQTYYSESKGVLNEMERMSPKMATTKWNWLDGAKSATMANDGMNRLDEAIGAVVRKDSGTTKGETAALASGASRTTPITKAQAMRVAKRAASAYEAQSWQATLHTKGQGAPYYAVNATAGGHAITTEVSATDGHLLAYHVDRPTADTSRYDFAQAADDASRWLKQQGYTHIVRTDAREADHVARFAFHQQYSGMTVYGQSIHVAVALDNGQVIGFHEVGNMPPANWKMPKVLSMASLRGKLSSSFHVQTTERVLWETTQGKWVPAVLYDGSLNDQPFRVALNEVNGQELTITQLS